MDHSTDKIILINKPYRWTSFDVVKKLRKTLLEEKRKSLPESERSHFKNYKVGHAGTLDPLATGLLILCTGKLTKKISEIQDAEKEYTGTITIGSTTASYDLEMPVENLTDTSHITDELIRETASGFLGKQQQIPPAHSAVKIDGQRAYERARKGQDFEIKSKEIAIVTFDITAIRLPEVDFRVICTKGTYIRTLASDFGKNLGTGAHLSALCRTRIGSYLLKDASDPLAFLAQFSDKQ